VLRLRNRCGATVQRGWRGPYRSLYSLQGDSAKRRCRHGVRHDSELNTVTGSCSYEPSSTRALKSLVSYIAPLRMTRAGAVYGDAGPSAGSGTWQVCSAESRDARGRGQKRKGPPSVPLEGREPQAACTDMPWRRKRAPRRSPGRTPARAAARKNEEAPCRLGRGPVSDKRLVLTSRGATFGHLALQRLRGHGHLQVGV